MKKIIIFFSIVVVLQTNGRAQATPSGEASEIAQKLKDSLNLTDQQKSQIELATINLQSMKAGLRSRYSRNALEYYLYMVENMRDTLYKSLLPADKYLIYQQKKRKPI